MENLLKSLWSILKTSKSKIKSNITKIALKCLKKQCQNKYPFKRENNKSKI